MSEAFQVGFDLLKRMSRRGPPLTREERMRASGAMPTPGLREDHKQYYDFLLGLGESGVPMLRYPGFLMRRFPELDEQMAAEIIRVFLQYYDYIDIALRGDQDGY
jgi:hypothetical protein